MKSMRWSPSKTSSVLSSRSSPSIITTYTSTTPFSRSSGSQNQPSLPTITPAPERKKINLLKLVVLQSQLQPLLLLPARHQSSKSSTRRSITNSSRTMFSSPHHNHPTTPPNIPKHLNPKLTRNSKRPQQKMTKEPTRWNTQVASIYK